ncbi:MAG: hypothetical protein R6V00_10380 [Candidatus Aminicenantes bacterium]
MSSKNLIIVIVIIMIFLLIFSLGALYAVKAFHCQANTNELDVPYSNPQNNVIHMGQNPDWIHYCLEKPMVLKPGEKFNYHSALSLILGEILKRSS